VLDQRRLGAPKDLREQKKYNWEMMIHVPTVLQGFVAPDRSHMLVWYRSRRKTYSDSRSNPSSKLPLFADWAGIEIEAADQVLHERISVYTHCAKEACHFADGLPGFVDAEDLMEDVRAGLYGELLFLDEQLPGAEEQPSEAADAQVRAHCLLCKVNHTSDRAGCPG